MNDRQDPRRTGRPPCWLTVLALVFGCAPLPAWAQGGAVAVPAEPTLDQLAERKGRLQANRELSEAELADATAAYEEARPVLEQARADIAAARGFREAAENAPRETAAIRKQLEAPARSAGPAVGEGASLETVEGRLRDVRNEKAALDGRLAKLREQVDTLTAAPRTLRDSLAQAEAALAKIQAQPTSDAAAGAIEQARNFVQAARLRAAAARLERLRTELETLDSRLALATAERDRAAREAGRYATWVQELEALLSEKRAQVAQRTRQEAVRTEVESVGKHPLVQEVAEANAALARELADAVQAQNDLSAQRARVEKELERVAQEFQSVQQRVSVAGLSSVLGQVLREQRRALPDLRRFATRVRAREEAISTAGLAQLRVDEALQELGDGQARLDDLLARPEAASLDEAGQRTLRRDLAELLKDRRGMLEKLRAAYVDQLKELGELEYSEQRLVEQARAYAAFLDEKLLWIPSHAPFDAASIGQLLGGVAWLVNPANLAALGGAFNTQVLGRPLVLVLVALTVWVLWRSRRALRRSIEESAAAVRHVRTDRFMHTVNVALATLLLALPQALVPAFLGWRLGVDAAPEGYVAAASAGLLGIALPWLLLRAFRVMLVTQGLAVAHFRMREATARRIRRYVGSFMVVGLPAMFLVRMMEAQGDPELQSSLGRTAFVVVMGALIVLMHAMFHPGRGVISGDLARQPETWSARLRPLWYALAAGIPLLLAGLAAAGYYYTALRLNTHQIETVRLLLGAVIVYHLVLRALLVARRQMLVREASTGESARSSGVELSAEGSPVQVETPSFDLTAVSEQTRRLSRIVIGWSVVAGVYLIWTDVLPALAVLDEIALWESSALVDGQTVVQPIRITDVLLTLVLIVVFTVAARNLPGVLEIALLQRLPLDPGSRYAISTVSQYVIVAIGVVVVFQSMGVGWGQVQWLVAALGVGLGFGLQEIFANFVSGLIILFERPVRIGDTVTIGDLTGTVSRIRIRATTVTDWDNKEIVIPNKSFITDRLINWTLSDSIMRVKIPIGIAYGSDTDKAFKVIWDAAQKNPRVLEQPPMQLFFLGFGDSSLDFELRVFVGGLSDLVKVRHEINMDMEKALREAGIEIPFPQRDLHLRSAVSLEVRQPASDAE